MKSTNKTYNKYTVKVCNGNKTGRALLKLIFILYITLFCTCGYGIDSLPLDAATKDKVQNLVKDLHKAEEALESLVHEAEEKCPDLQRYKNKHKEVSEWYWGKRMEGWSEIDPGFFGSEPIEKAKRLKTYTRAKHLSTYIYLCELFSSLPDKEELLSRYFENPQLRRDIGNRFGINTLDNTLGLQDFFQKAKIAAPNKKIEFEKEILAWKEKYEFITPEVLAQAYKSAAAEFDIALLDIAIYQLTPQMIRDAENKVKKIRRELERTWPDWDEIYKEFKPTVDRLVEEETLPLFNSSSGQTPTVPQSVEKKTEKVVQSPLKLAEPKPVSLLHKTKANVLQPQRTRSYWWYVLLVVCIILGFLSLNRIIRKKLN